MRQTLQARRATGPFETVQKNIALSHGGDKAGLIKPGQDNAIVGRLDVEFSERLIETLAEQFRNVRALVLNEDELAIAGLPPDQRTVLLLVSVEGVAYREAAEILGLSIGTVMSRLARARLALARALEEPRRGSEPKGRSAKVIKLPPAAP
jgi:RNA polymerase sigma factor (sigma-70 family)